MKISPRTITVVREKLAYMYLDYRLYMDKMPVEETSVGLVARFGGEKTSQTYKITKLTEILAIERANKSPAVMSKIAWFECVWHVYTRLVTSNSGSGVTKRRNRKIAHILHLHVFLGWTFTKISGEPLPGTDETVSRQRVYDLYTAAVELVAEEAIRRGLISEPQA